MGEAAEKTSSSDAPTASDADRYIEERVRQYQSWYDRKSTLCKSRYI